MKTTDELANKADGGEDKPRFVKEERVDEGWTVTPNDGAASDPFEDDEDDDDNDVSFYTREDYENCPVLRRILTDLGGDDPLADEETDDDK